MTRKPAPPKSVWVYIDKIGNPFGTSTFRMTTGYNGPSVRYDLASPAAKSEIAKAVADATSNGATSIIGGGDSIAAVHKAGVAARISHISTGGGASLEFLAGEELPGVSALTDI